MAEDDLPEVLFRARLYRTERDTPWGFRLQGGVEFNKPLTLLKVSIAPVVNVDAISVPAPIGGVTRAPIRIISSLHVGPVDMLDGCLLESRLMRFVGWCMINSDVLRNRSFRPQIVISF